MSFTLTGGHVIDPANNIDGPADVEITEGRVSQVAPEPSDSTGSVIDVSGCYVVPGIIDIHTHVYTFTPTSASYVGGIHADAHLFSSGVTTTVDAGTAGWENFGDFKERCIDRSKVRILAFLNIARAGMTDAESEQRAQDLDPEKAAEIALAYGDTIVGIKSAHYWTQLPWDEQHQPWTSVERAIAAGELCGKPVMVDFWPRPPERSYQDLLLKLRPGDMHTHVFAQQFPVLVDQKSVNPIYQEARERGVLFDLGHGAASFWFRNGAPAFDDGFYPDTISTDLHMANINGPVHSMLYTMSKCLAMGMSIQDVVARSTMKPAQVIDHPELGTLGVGSEADVTVLKRHDGAFSYVDCGKARLAAREKLECAMTIKAGEIVYDPSGLSMPEWEHAPPAYWDIQRK